MKQKIIWSCSECGHTQSKWTGQCYQCNKWNTFAEEIDYAPEKMRFSSHLPSVPQRIDEIVAQDTPRFLTQMPELDRLLGGGIVQGGLMLVGGDPGIGKSTLLLQTANQLAKQGLTILYVCGEESTSQTSLRAKRLGVTSENLLLYAETDLTLIKKQIDTLNPDVVVIDSIQIVYKSEIPSAPGSVSQVRESAVEFMHLAKGKGISIFLIGHVTKSGEIAGPRVLEHLVDAVFYFEGDRQHHFRMLRSIKNRFGSTDELAVFQMSEQGLVEITNPSQIFLEERMRGNPGSIITPTIEGSRPILVEIQALVTPTGFATPARRFAGLDANRLSLLLAVMEKRVGYQLHTRDVFVSIAGGLKIAETAIDLGLIIAVASSLTNKPIDADTVILGEVGLGGEIRRVPRIETRLKEAAHMGFKKAIVPQNNLKNHFNHTLLLVGVERVEEAIRAALG